MLRFLLFLIIVAYLFSSCKQHRDTSSLNRIAASLKVANESILQDNKNIYYAILEKTRDPHTGASAVTWLPKADTINNLSNELLDWIKQLKGEIPGEAKAQDLYHKLFDYKERVSSFFKIEAFAGNPISGQHIHNESIPLLKDLPVISGMGSIVKEENWVDHTFKNANTALSETLLCSIENNVLVSQNQLLNYFLSKSAVHLTGPCEMNVPIVVLNSSYVKSGDVIEVTAGMPSFRIDAKPIITIDDKQIALNVDGSATYSFRTRKRPGKYSVPVKVEYTKPDGTKESIFKNCYYTVAQ